jgi:hypothetical protein
VHDIGSHHDFRLKAVEQQEHHHHNAARAHRCNAHQKAGHHSDEPHPGERLHRRRAHRGPVFDFLLEKQECGNANQQHSYRDRDEVVDAVAVDVSQVNQITYAQIRSGSAAGCERQNNFAPNCTFAQMNPTGADLGHEVEQRVRADGANGRDVQAEDEDREQQNAAPESRHSNEGPDSKTHQALDQQIHDNTGFSLPVIRWRQPESSDRLRRRSDEAFPLQMQDDFLRCFFGGQFAGIDGDFGIGRYFVWIRDARKFL